MTARRAASLAVAMWLVGMGSLLASEPLLRASEELAGRPYSLVDSLAFALAWVGFGAVGAAIVSRRPEHRIGWILCGITFIVGVALALEEVVRYQGLTGVGGPVVTFAAWMTTWLFLPAMLLVVLLVALFPNGELPGTRVGRAAVRVAVVVWVLDVVAFMVKPGPVGAPGSPDNPLGLPVGGVLEDVTGAFGTVLGVTAVVLVGDLVVRFRRSRGVERAQFRWFALGAVVMPVVFAVGILLSYRYDVEGQMDVSDLVVVSAWTLGMNALAAGIGVAVARHRLYDMGRLVRRTVAWSLVSAVLVALYASMAAGLPLLLGIEDASDLVVAGATLAAAALVRPVHRRVQTLVDHRFDRRRADAVTEVALFATRVRDEVDVAQLVDDVVATASATMQPSAVRLWLPEPAP